MNENYSSLIQKHIDILSLRDLSESTIANYTAYLREFFEWAEEQLGGKDPSGISLDELHAYIRHLQVDLGQLFNKKVAVLSIQKR